MPTTPTRWRDHLRYRFENTLSRGPVAIIAWLALISGVIVIATAIVLSLLRIGQDPTDPNSQFGFVEGAWVGLMHAIDAGNLAGDSGWALRGLMFIVTVAGIFLVSILIGTITSGLEARLDDMRKGRSRVIEREHTLILGWSSKIHSIIGELVIANANQKRPCIVILANRDKVEMEDDIQAKFPDTKNTRVICRSGDPLDLDDLAVVDPHGARSIIVLAPEDDNPDIHVIKSVLAITNNPERKTGRYHIVGEIREAKNLEAAALVGGDEAIFVQGEDLIARVTAQTCRQSGLSVVYTELMDFDGTEIYFKDEPALVGKTYREALGAYEASTVIGLMQADGAVAVNPPMDRRIAAGDRIIAISEDDDTIRLGSTAGAPQTAMIQAAPARSASPERILILGWNDKAAAIVRELDQYVAPGSELVVLCERDGARDALMALSTSTQKLRVRHEDGDIDDRATLDRLGVCDYAHIILLSYNHLPIQEADAKTLIALLHLRNIADAANADLAIVSEMMDLRNRALAQVAKADDFIVSDKLVSLMLAQLSENRDLDRVFRALFSAEGAEIYLRPVGDYVRTGAALDFHTLLEAAAQRGETAIGYRIAADAQDKEHGYGVRMNPNKSDKVVFAPNDRIIVLAED
ncbi:MAG TPA: potassium transporter TrkA [Patescibacteria group bacterium]|nr:potassium transporter TrkA [Patescibacteria group bacterium]